MWRMNGSVVLVSLAMASAAYAQSPTDMWFSGMCGRDGGMMEDMLRKARNDGLPVLRSDERYIAYENTANGGVLVFTQPAHPAHPSIACLETEKHHGGKGMSVEVECGGDSDACDAMAHELEQPDTFAGEAQ